ncbi:MAG: phage tail assembly protein [Afipia sp.]|nr:phage tail assembly protein [Afipia sp.]
MPDITIPLSKPITAHDKKITSLVLREPGYTDIMTLGEPSAFARDAAGMVYTAEKDEVIKAYIERLLVDVDPLLLTQLNAPDTFKLRDAVHGFFSAARQPTT